ncbi:MAG: gamma-glutamyl-gamma-aminobutyrate hydrolase family protein [Clostridia bacterium]|nr:gamma-glutamyl-gamma-aminobutyrate hydrolase family protein [Clostridia bacterium]
MSMYAATEYKPLIGITPQYEIERERSWIRSTYTNAVIRAGGIPVILDQYTDPAVIESLLPRLDGILFTGGVDINPKLYGEEIDEKCGEIADVRDAFEVRLMAVVEQYEIPVFGICRGIQTLNVLCGGSLHQHRDHHQGVRHDVDVVEGTRLHEIVGKTKINSNSYHHQCVKVPAPGMTVTAYAEDGTVEAIERPGDRFFVGVQWHPELLSANEEDHNALFLAFVEAARVYRAAL